MILDLSLHRCHDVLNLQMQTQQVWLLVSLHHLQVQVQSSHHSWVPIPVEELYETSSVDGKNDLKFKPDSYQMWDIDL